MKLPVPFIQLPLRFDAALLAADAGRDHRQLHMLDAQGHGFRFTGKECVDWCGAIGADNASVAGNMLAGPTEIVVTSEQGGAEGIASDLVAQAEHDPEALAIFIPTRLDLARAVIAETKLRARSNPIAKQSLACNGLVIVATSIKEAHAITNRIAPEHLTVDTAADLDWVQNAGSVFVGPWSAQPMGDYISGPNHTLPTGALARVRGGLSVNDFVKLITVQEYNAAALASLGPKAALLAEAEGLVGHAEAIGVRLRAAKKGGRRA